MQYWACYECTFIAEKPYDDGGCRRLWYVAYSTMKRLLHHAIHLRTSNGRIRTSYLTCSIFVHVSTLLRNAFWWQDIVFGYFKYVASWRLTAEPTSLINTIELLIICETQRIDFETLPITPQAQHISDPVEIIWYSTNANLPNENGWEGCKTGFYW